MKRTALVLLLAGLVPVAVRALPPAPASAAVGFRGDARGRGVAPGRVPHRRPHPLWTVRTEGPIRSTPLRAGGRLHFGSGDGNLWTVDARTGKVLWTAATGGAVDGSPVLAGGLVVVASRDRVLRAFDPKTGAGRWRFAFGEELPFRWGWDYILSSAAVAGDTLFVGGGDGNVYALDTKSGRERWRFATRGRVRSSPAVADGVVYAGSFDGHLYALDAATGKERWRFATEGVSHDLEKFGFDRRSIQGSPTVAGDAVLVGARDGHLYAVERADGRKRWSFDHVVSWVVGTPAYADGVAYVGSSDGLFVQAIDVASGKELWRTPTGINVLTSPLLVGDVLLCGGTDGHVWGLDRATGRELWTWLASDSVIASLVAADGAIFVATGDGVLTALGGDLDAAPITAARAVYADPDAKWRWQKADREVADGLARLGYRRLDAAGLVKLLETHTAAKTPSVVVIAGGNVPTAIEGDATENAPVRKYLEAGGRIVWLGGPPFAVVLDPKTGEPSAFDGKRTERILGVAPRGMWLGEERIVATAAGRRAGLPPWWVSDIAVTPAPEMEVLGTNPEGLASAWRVKYGTKGVFAYVSGRDRLPPALPVILAAAEEGLE
jgi:outer membrane protein assembly factor BamB